MAMERGAGGLGVQGERTVGDMRDEELDDAIDSEIEKVRRTTYRTDFSEGSLCCWTPRECLSPERWSFSDFHIKQWL